MQNRALHRSLAVLVTAVLLIQATGPSYAALRNETTAPTDHGHGTPAHHEGCPWEGTGDCPHAQDHGDGPGLASCGDDDALAANESPRAVPTAIQHRPSEHVSARFEEAFLPPPRLDPPHPDQLLDTPPPRERAA